jgi:hypothetical protein
MSGRISETSGVVFAVVLEGFDVCVEEKTGSESETFATALPVQVDSMFVFCSCFRSIHFFAFSKFLMPFLFGSFSSRFP